MWVQDCPLHVRMLLDCGYRWVLVQEHTRRGMPTGERRYRNALLYLLTSQTSCFRYWGQGQWTDYGRELCRRTKDILEHDF